MRNEIRAGTRQIADKIHAAIMAFQFYDKLVQRLDHVCQSLGGLSSVVADQRRLYNPGEWVALQQQIRGKYTMEEERAMFDAVLHGIPVKEAVETYLHARMEQVEASGGDIELF